MSRFSQHPVDEDGWTGWITPTTYGYKMGCCDCGLVHHVEFRTLNGRVQYRARRNERSTSAKRRGAKLKRVGDFLRALAWSKGEEEKMRRWYEKSFKPKPKTAQEQANLLWQRFGVVAMTHYKVRDLPDSVASLVFDALLSPAALTKADVEWAQECIKEIEAHNPGKVDTI